MLMGSGKVPQPAALRHRERVLGESGHARGRRARPGARAVPGERDLRGRAFRAADAAAPAGEVLLATVSGHVPFRLGRGNMSVWTLDTVHEGAEPVSKVDVWPNAAGYSDFAQTKSGRMLLLYEAGGHTYDYGIK